MMADKKTALPGIAPDPHAAAGGKVVRAVTIIVLVVALTAGAFALAQLDTWGESSAEVPQRFELDLQAQVEIPPDLIAYVEQSQFDTTLTAPEALAVSADGTVLVAGDQTVVRLSPAGQVLGAIPLEQKPTCLAVAAAGADSAEQILVGCGRHVVVFSMQGEPVGQWPDLEPQAVLTAIAAGPQRVFVADAGQRLVHILDRAGRAIGRIGAVDPGRHAAEFVIPSRHFDLAVDQEALLWVVNPGKRHLESYADTGDLQSMWGEAGGGIADFFGCCNPAHIALLPDGRFVTSEKGIPRIKVYSAAGEFVHVVAGPRELGVSASALVDARSGQSERVFDVAVSPAGAILVLDTRERCVRVFVPKKTEAKPS